MGGYVSLGYDAASRTMVINEAEAQTARRLFNLYAEHRAVSIVAREDERILRKHLGTAMPRGLFADADAHSIQRGLTLLE